jgi:hypothetical protein
MSTSPLKLKNILKQQTHINQQLFQAASTSNTIPHSIPAQLHKTTQQIETICTKHQLTPTALAKPSRNAYTWMKFLTNLNNLQLHFDTLVRSISISQEIIKTQGKGQIFIEFTHGSNLYKFRAINNLTTLNISESFIHSSDQVLTAVLQTALHQKNTTASEIIRKFSLSEECSDVLLELDPNSHRNRPRQHLQPRPPLQLHQPPILRRSHEQTPPHVEQHLISPQTWPL